jgi:hypothetical protein
MSKHELIEGIAIDELESDPILTEGEQGDDDRDQDGGDDDEDADAPESEEDASGDL